MYQRCSGPNSRLPLLVNQTAVWQLCAPVWEDVCRETEGLCFFDSVCDRVWKIEKQLLQFTPHLRPHGSCFCWGLLTRGKQIKNIRSALLLAPQRKEVGGRREGARWNNTIKTFIFWVTYWPTLEENSKRCRIELVLSWLSHTRASFSSWFRHLKVFVSLLRIYGCIWKFIVRFAKSHLQVLWHHKPHQRNSLFRCRQI